MSNQIAIKAQTAPGDELICDYSAHIYQYEGGGIAFNSGVQVNLVHGDRGRISTSQAEEHINARDDVHKANTSLVCLENSSNKGGGSCYELAEIEGIREICDRNNLKLHLDGARLFNAMIAKNQSPKEFGRLFNSISVCLNKGLGCPIGSMLLGSKELIHKSRRIRKVMGGGMRQAGYMAACGIYALEFNIERLREDHLHARLLAEELEKLDCCAEILPVETNIVIVRLKEGIHTDTVLERFKQAQVLALPFSKDQIRFVLHLGVTRAMLDYAITRIREIF